MRILVAGRGNLAVRGAHLLALLAQLRADGSAVECIVTEDDQDGGEWRLSLARAAGEEGWRIHRSILEAALGPADLLVSLQYHKKIAMELLGGAHAVNLHFSALPRHRGSLSCYWPIAERDPRAGVTLHEMTEEVDAGPVIAAREFPLPRFITAGELFQVFHAHAFDLFAESAASVLEGSYTPRPQPPIADLAHRRRDVDFTQREINFTQPVTRVHDLVRAHAFPEFQLPLFRGRPVSRSVMPAFGALPIGVRPGEIIAQTGHAALVGCADGVIQLEFAAPSPPPPTSGIDRQQDEARN